MLNPRFLSLISLLIITPLGFFSKAYNGPGQVWFNQNLGGLLYEIFWCLFFFCFIPSKKAIQQIPLGVFFFTCILELMQLWRNPAVIEIRSTLFGRLFLGTTFSWLDFPHYLLGCFIGWLWLKLIWKHSSIET